MQQQIGSPAAPDPGLTSPNTSNLRRLAALRAITLTSLALTGIYLAQSDVASLGLNLALYLALGAIATVTSAWRSLKKQPVSNWGFCAHLLADWLWLTPLLMASGGAANPFVAYYLVPLLIAAATLPRRFVWGIAALAIASYTALLPSSGGAHAHHGSGFQQHLLGMWATFSLTAILVALFVSEMNVALRRRDRRLAQLQAERDRNDQFLSIATLAAGAAHELATPLHNMQMIADELQREDMDADARREDLQLLRKQITQCNRTLADLKQRAVNPCQGDAKTLPEWLQKLLDQWQLLRPEVRYNTCLLGNPESCYQLPLALEQTLTNLLNNAADTGSSHPIEIRACWNASGAVISVRDFGGGLSAGMDGEEQSTGNKSRERPGMGIGLLLSRKALEQFDGELDLRECATEEGRPKGSLAEMRFPLSRWEVEAGKQPGEAVHA
ncbi:ATP-binding protein [Biformimicrobium ophioploci]|uniref:histidine kinase n=1 Tax=Biformimicrobium ophioploci TaxID=3036711 RepID=A0ABQ6LYH9_9GAMM|nr:ATP-binding protein [Microbulbifer sp. NKW57]GMG87124.1 ATP-binding protein [Microbulbifer sp. NKW57]